MTDITFDALCNTGLCYCSEILLALNGGVEPQTPPFVRTPLYQLIRLVFLVTYATCFVLKLFGYLLLTVTKDHVST